MGICVVTDPSAVMPARWLQERPLRLIPLEIAWADGTTQPGELPYSQISQRLQEAAEAPTTGAPSPGLYNQVIDELLGTHDGVLIVCPSADLSTTFQSAVLGAQAAGPDRVRVIDSTTAAAGQGIVAAEAALVAQRGATLPQTVDRALDVASRVNIWATLSQLDFLRRSGRVPAVAAIGAGALHLQPVVRYAGASPSPVGVVRGTARGADRLYRAWERSTIDGARATCVAFHSDRRQDAEAVAGRIVQRSPVADAHVVEVSASLASHTGAGLLGLAWFWDLES